MKFVKNRFRLFRNEKIMLHIMCNEFNSLHIMCTSHLLHIMCNKIYMCTSRQNIFLHDTHYV